MKKRACWFIILSLLSGCGLRPSAPILIQEILGGTGGERPADPEEVRHVKALLIYAQDAKDDYPFPSRSMMSQLFSRVSNYYKVMSYGQHELEYIPITNDGGYFRSSLKVQDYKVQYRDNPALTKKYDGPFGLFNEEILNMVVQKKGAEIFVDVDLIIIVGTDGGPDWYVPGFNAGGFARLGFEFKIANRTFSPMYGGITLEIGSHAIKDLYPVCMLNWLFAHEYAHWLGYRKHRPNRIGVYSLMTQSLHIDLDEPNASLGPSPLDPFLINRFGWIDFNDENRVRVLEACEEPVRVTLNDIRAHEGQILAKIRIPGTEIANHSDGETLEHFYIAYHRKDANDFDNVYPATGLLIWHVTRNEILDVECGQAATADGKRDHLDLGENLQGIASDFFNSENGLEFTPDSHPNTSIWGLAETSLQGMPSGISITNVQEAGIRVSFTVTFDMEIAQKNRESGEQPQALANQTQPEFSSSEYHDPQFRDVNGDRFICIERE